MTHHLQRLARLSSSRPDAYERPMQVQRSFALADDPVTDANTGAVTCPCTSSKVGYAALGALVGGAAIWLLNDGQKANAKELAKYGAKRGAAAAKSGARSAAAKGKAYAARKRDEKYDRDRERSARAIERKADEYERRGMLQDAKDMRANARYVRSTLSDSSRTRLRTCGEDDRCGGRTLAWLEVQAELRKEAMSIRTVILVDSSTRNPSLREALERVCRAHDVAIVVQQPDVGVTLEAEAQVIERTIMHRAYDSLMSYDRVFRGASGYRLRDELVAHVETEDVRARHRHGWLTSFVGKPAKVKPVRKLPPADPVRLAQAMSVAPVETRAQRRERLRSCNGR